jgi:hypothetical protein
VPSIALKSIIDQKCTLPPASREPTVFKGFSGDLSAVVEEGESKAGHDSADPAATYALAPPEKSELARVTHG